MLHFSYSRINGADFWTVVDIFDRVVGSKRKFYRNGLQEGDLKVPLCGFGGVKCKCVCFFAWNLELILSSFEDRSSDSVLPCLLPSVASKRVHARKQHVLIGCKHAAKHFASLQTSPISFVATKEIGDVCTQATKHSKFGVGGCCGLDLFSLNTIFFARLFRC